MYTDVNNLNTNSLYYNNTGVWVTSGSRCYIPPRLPHCAAPCRCVCVHTGCAAQGLCSIPSQSQPHKACSLSLLHSRIAAGVYQILHKTRDLNCPWVLSVHCTTHRMGQQLQAQPASAKGNLLNNKSTEKKISVTHVAVCRQPRAPSCAPILPHSASCLWCCRSPSSIQGTIWSLGKLCVQVGTFDLIFFLFIHYNGRWGLNPIPTGLAPTKQKNMEDWVQPPELPG